MLDEGEARGTYRYNGRFLDVRDHLIRGQISNLWM
jgi:hypothetical protein